MRHLVVEAYDRVVKLSEEKRDITGLATGYHDLDKMTSGFQGDQLIIIAARPSVGKTAFALNIAQNVGYQIQGASCHLFSRNGGD